MAAKLQIRDYTGIIACQIYNWRINNKLLARDVRLANRIAHKQHCLCLNSRASQFPTTRRL